MTSNFSNWISKGQFYQRQNGQKIFCHHVGGEGQDVLFLHGFPTSSFDWVTVFENLSGRGKLTCFDFLGFGASDKPADHQYHFNEQADIASEIAAKYDISSCILVAHDYGVTVAQELLRRQSSNSLAFRIQTVIFLNGGIYHHVNRPATIQKILLMPVVGPIVARLMNQSMFENAMAKLFVGKYKLNKVESGELWEGIIRNNGNMISHKLLHYIAERKANGHQWEAAMEESQVPLILIWGLLDPVSGRVLDYAKDRLKEAQIVELSDVSHYPQIEAPDTVSQVVLDAM